MVDDGFIWQHLDTLVELIFKTVTKSQFSFKRFGTHCEYRLTRSSEEQKPNRPDSHGETSVGEIAIGTAQPVYTG